MAYERKEGDISIFKNDKGDNEKRPDYTGTALINGKLVSISLWVKDGNSGKFFSGRIENKQENTKTTSPVNDTNDSDSLPF